MNRVLRTAIALCALAAAAACRDTTAPEIDVMDAALVNLAISSVPVLQVTSIPHAGQAFEVRVQSYGLDGCWVADRAVVTSNELSATITPFNRSTASATSGCTQAIIAIPHRVMLTFSSAGQKTIILRARDFSTGAPLQLEVPVTVVP